MVTAAITVALRRADEMGDAIAARGGTGQISAAPSRPRWPDAVALLIVAAVSAVAIVSELLLGSTRSSSLAGPLAVGRGVGRRLAWRQCLCDVEAAEEHFVEVRLERLESGREAGPARRGNPRAAQHVEERGDVHALGRPVVEVGRAARRAPPGSPRRRPRSTALPSALPIQSSTVRTASGCREAELPAAAMPLVTLTRPAGPAGSNATPHRNGALAATCARL